MKLIHHLFYNPVTEFLHQETRDEIMQFSQIARQIYIYIYKARDKCIWKICNFRVTQFSKLCHRSIKDWIFSRGEHKTFITTLINSIRYKKKENSELTILDIK